MELRIDNHSLTTRPFSDSSSDELYGHTWAVCLPFPKQSNCLKSNEYHNTNCHCFFLSSMYVVHIQSLLRQNTCKVNMYNAHWHLNTRIYCSVILIAIQMHISPISPLTFISGLMLTGTLCSFKCVLCPLKACNPFLTSYIPNT
jgi:hypothetical protein